MNHELEDIIKTVNLNAPIEEVWEVVTTSEGIASWWMDNTLEPELDNHFVLHAGPYGDSECKVNKYEPHHLFQFSWDTDWTLTFELAKIDHSNTQFTLIHSGWPIEKERIREVMNNGWDTIVNENLPKAVNEYK